MLVEVLFILVLAQVVNVGGKNSGCDLCTIQNTEILDKIADLMTEVTKLKDESAARFKDLEDRLTETVSNETNAIKRNIQHLQTTTTQDLANLNSGLQTTQECMEEVKNKQSNLTQDLMEAKTVVEDLATTLTEEFNNVNKNLKITVGSVHYPETSCSHVSMVYPTVETGYYWVENRQGEPTRVYCNMERECCGSRGGWMRVANLDMRDPTHQCPPGLTGRTEAGKRLCGRPNDGCVSINYATHNIEYSKVCGKVIGYHFGTPDAFLAYYDNRDLTLEGNYVDGVSITHGTPRQHIWTFAGATREAAVDHRRCPCMRDDPDYSGAVPPFIEDHYFCDTGVLSGERYRGIVLYPSHPLWDGQDCSIGSCCTFNSPPWFCRELPEPTTDDIELRVCSDDNVQDEDTRIEQIELYVQ